MAIARASREFALEAEEDYLLCVVRIQALAARGRGLERGEV
jgi:hypothetical protein